MQISSSFIFVSNKILIIFLFFFLKINCIQLDLDVKCNTVIESHSEYFCFESQIKSNDSLIIEHLGNGSLKIEISPKHIKINHQKNFFDLALELFAYIHI